MRISAGGSRIRNNKVAFSNLSGIVWTGPYNLFTLMMASAQVVETSVNTKNSPSQDYTTSPNDHSNHNIDSPGFKPFIVIKFLVENTQCGKLLINAKPKIRASSFDLVEFASEYLFKSESAKRKLLSSSL